jgi:biopolymer transport protein ExbB/TolQ
MNQQHGIVNTLLGLPIFQAEWVLYLLILLSFISVAVMVERWIFYKKHQVDSEAIRVELNKLLSVGDYGGAAAYLQKFDSLETNVVLCGLREYETGPDSVEDLIRGAEAKEKLRYNKWLSFLATVGSNSPFIGLFGTVLGIIRAFADLGADMGGAGGSVMAGISEALIATAVGLLVAIPAVIAYNAFSGRVKTVIANSELLSRTLLSASSRPTKPPRRGWG